MFNYHASYVYVKIRVPQIINHLNRYIKLITREISRYDLSSNVIYKTKIIFGVYLSHILRLDQDKSSPNNQLFKPIEIFHVLQT